MSNFKRSGDSVQALDENSSVDQFFQLTISVSLEATVAVHPMISFRRAIPLDLQCSAQGACSEPAAEGAWRG
jgi:hypothetical protein